MAATGAVSPPPAPVDGRTALSAADSMASSSAPTSPMSGLGAAASPEREGSAPVQSSVAGRSSSIATAENSSKPRGHLVQLAEKEDRARAVIKGYLKKENSQGKWQKRWFEVVSHYFVYYKRNDSGTMLCAMDLWKAHNPEVRTRAAPDGTKVPTNEFSIRWDRFRLFRADTPEESVRWVNVLQATQAANPALAQAESGTMGAVDSDGGTEKAGGGCCLIM